MPGHETVAKPLGVVIAGGGVGALEAVLALHTLAEARVKATLVAAAEVFSYRPMAVLEPFVHRPPRELGLARLAAELDVDFLADTIVAGADRADAV
jgi:sulfide:quinone oxidoreductase